MFWLIPTTVSALTALLYLLLGTTQDQSGAGMVGVFLLIPVLIVNLSAWSLYDIAGAALGIH